MPYANAPTRSVVSCNLIINNEAVPIKVYKGFENIGLSGHLYHEGCSGGLTGDDGKIYQDRRCEFHPDLPFPATYSALDFAGERIAIPPTIRKELLGRDCELEVVGTFLLSGLSKLIADRKVVPFGVYQIYAMDGFEGLLSALLARLHTKKRYLLLTGPFGMKRYAILLPDGTILPLLYEEEIRINKFEKTDYDKWDQRRANWLIEKIPTADFPQMTATPILKALDAWKASQVVRIKKGGQKLVRGLRGPAKGKSKV